MPIWLIFYLKFFITIEFNSALNNINNGQWHIDGNDDYYIKTLFSQVSRVWTMQEDYKPNSNNIADLFTRKQVRRVFKIIILMILRGQ